MKKLSLFILLAAMAVAASSKPRNLPIPTDLAADAAATQAGNGAFRDGLHLGRFDAKSGRAQHVCVGRWGTDVDRASFQAGYSAGYQERAGE